MHKPFSRSELELLSIHAGSRSLLNLCPYRMGTAIPTFQNTLEKGRVNEDMRCKRILGPEELLSTIQPSATSLGYAPFFFIVQMLRRLSERKFAHCSALHRYHFLTTSEADTLGL